MKSTSPAPRRRPVRRLALPLSLTLLTAALLPFVTHGQLPGRIEPQGAISPHPAAPAPRKHNEFVAGHVLVRFRTEAAAQTAEAAPAVLPLEDGPPADVRVERFAGSEVVKGLRLASVPPDQTLQAVAALQQRPDVLYAEPDYLVHIERLPSEAEFLNMWGLRNVGQLIADHFESGDRGQPQRLCATPPCTFSAGTSGADIKAEQAWDITTGSPNIVVGVIDEGLDINHPDLAPNIFHNPGEIPGNGIDDDGNGFVDDTTGWDFAANDNTVFDGPGTYPASLTDAHGTHVAGTIGARGNNGLGSVGVNWQVSLLPLKFISGSGGATSNAIRAAAYAKALRDKFVATGGAQGANVRVLNNSYGGGGYQQSFQDVINALAASQILFVAAAGNGDDNGVGINNDLEPQYPANYTGANILSVAASTRNDVLTGFTNRGQRTVHLAAPGGLVLSTTPNGTYDFYSGTSMATPHVAGVAALALAANPNLSVQQLRSALLYSGDVTGGAISSNTYSQRRLNAFQTVRTAIENDTTPPAAPANLRVIGGGGNQVQLAWTESGDDGTTGQAALYELSFVDPGTNVSTLLATLLPQSPGAGASTTVTIPLRHVAGLVRLKVFDNAGNESQASVAVALDPAVIDPYTPTESAATPFASGAGGALNLRADDATRSLTFPGGFVFPFYGQNYSTATVSTNGIIYFGPAPTANDAGSGIIALNGLTAIAGLWDDLRTDRRVGDDIYMTQPDPDRLVFRWQGVTYDTPLSPTTGRGENPIGFEIELRRNGDIVLRYGAGNNNVSPVVGISGGQPDAYLVRSHTSEFPSLVSLANAGTVNFTRRSALSPVVQFAAAGFTVNEDAGAVTLTITRTNNLAAAASVGFTTIDDTAEVGCADTLNNRGAAYARCDYATTVDTIQFGPGEASKTLTIPIIDDGHFEGAETFQVALTNPSAGLALNTPALTTVTIQDNDTATTPNPLGGPGQANPAAARTFFVRQQYLDFLSREPEAGEPWTGVLSGCADEFNVPSDTPSAACDRIIVSQSFFGSPEFQLKGLFVFRFYKVAFARLPAYAEIVPDMRNVTGQTGAEVFQKKAAFTEQFAQRPEFNVAYAGLSNAQYVAALFARYGLATITTPNPAAPDDASAANKVTFTSNDLAVRLNNGSLTRGQVLRAVADSDQVLTAEATNAFVAMQYYGYLRRTPEAAGYQSWLNYLSAHPTDFRTMVNGFMNSREYRLRFGREQ